MADEPVQKNTTKTVQLACHKPEKWTRVAKFFSTKCEAFSDFLTAFDELHGNRATKNYFEFMPKDVEDALDGRITQAKFITTVFPFMQQLAMKQPELFPTPLVLLRQQVDARVVFTRQQIACLLVHSVFHTHPQPGPDIPGASFAGLLSSSNNPTLDCTFHYFTRLAEQGIPKGNLVIHRKVATPKGVEFWSENTAPLANVVVRPGSIEDDMEASFHADFANRFLGGGVLGGGRVQEEILFSVKPELIASMLFVEVMADNEAIVITGAERFAKHKGYGYSFRFDGNFPDTTPFNETHQFVHNHVVAVDAIVNFGNREFSQNSLLRDINKLWVALLDWWRDDDPLADNIPAKPQVYATGNWGCGAFGGDKQLKAIQQLLAASAVGIDVHYFPFDDAGFGEKFAALLGELSAARVTTGRLFQILLSIGPTRQLFDGIRLRLKDSTATPE